MCLQDLAIAAGCRVQVETGTAGEDEVVNVGDLRRVYWMYARSNGSAAFLSSTSGYDDGVNPPPDNTLGFAGTPDVYYSFRSLAGIASGTVTFRQASSGGYTIVKCVWDASVDSLVTKLLYGGMG